MTEIKTSQWGLPTIRHSQHNLTRKSLHIQSRSQWLARAAATRQRARGSAWCQEEDEGEGGRRRGGRTRGRRRRWRRIGVSRRRGVWRGRGKRGRGKRGRGGEGGERERAREVRDERVSELFWLSCCCCLLPQSSAVIMAASGTLRRPTASFGLSCRDPEQPRFVAFATLFVSPAGSQFLTCSG